MKVVDRFKVNKPAEGPRKFSFGQRFAGIDAINASMMRRLP